MICAVLHTNFATGKKRIKPACLCTQLMRGYTVKRTQKPPEQNSPKKNVGIGLMLGHTVRVFVGAKLVLFINVKARLLHKWW